MRGTEMFKLSVMTDEVSQDLEVVSKFAKNLNLNGVEIRNVWGKPPQDLLKELNKVKRILKKYGLEVSVIASPFFKADLKNPEEYTKHLDILEKSISLAKELDTKIIRGFTFWRNGTLDEHIDEIAEKFQKPLEILEKEGVILAIENEPSTFVGNGRELAQFLNKIGSKNVGAIWDPGNDIWDSLGEVPYPDGYNYVKEKIVHVHIKDGVRKGAEGKFKFVAFGEGEVKYLDQLKALKKDGYPGYLSLETHWRLKKPLSKNVVIRPAGDEFSVLGEESSRICMENLQAMLRKI
jgi:sugar phosphate isomerase/epimerase